MYAVDCRARKKETDDMKKLLDVFTFFFSFIYISVIPAVKISSEQPITFVFLLFSSTVMHISGCCWFFSLYIQLLFLQHANTWPLGERLRTGGAKNWKKHKLWNQSFLFPLRHRTFAAKMYRLYFTAELLIQIVIWLTVFLWWDVICYTE